VEREGDCVEEGECVRVGKEEREGHAEEDSDGDVLEEEHFEESAEKLGEAVAQRVTRGVAELQRDPEGEEVIDLEMSPVRDTVGEEDMDGERVCEGDAVKETDSEELPLVQWLTVREFREDFETEGDGEVVFETKMLGVGDVLNVTVGQDVEEAVWDGVIMDVVETLGQEVTLKDVVGERDTNILPVGDILVKEVPEMEGLGVELGVINEVGEWEGVMEVEGQEDTLWVDEVVTVSVFNEEGDTVAEVHDVGVVDTEGQPEEEKVTLGVALVVCVNEDVTLMVDDCDTVAQLEAVVDGDPVCEVEAHWVGVNEAVGEEEEEVIDEELGDTVTVNDRVGVTLELPERENLGDAEGLTEGERV